MSTPLARLADPIPFRKLLDEAVKQTRRTLKPLYLWALLPALALQVPTALIQGAQFRLGNPENPSPAALGAIFGGCGLLILALPIYFFCSVAVAMAATDGVAGRTVAAGPRLRSALHPRIWLTLLAVTVLVLVLPSLLFGVGVVIAAIAATASSPGLAAAGMLGALALSVLSVVFFATRFAFIVQVMTEEGSSGLTAIGRTFRLISANPGRRFVDNTVTKVFVVGVVFYALSAALSLPLQLPFTAGLLVTVIRGALEGGAPDQLLAQGAAPWLMTLMNLAGTFGQAAAQLFFFNALSLLYFDVRRRREAPDLVEAVAEVERSQQPAPPPAVPPPAAAPPGGWGAEPA